jgi:hypothetical protein
MLLIIEMAQNCRKKEFSNTVSGRFPLYGLAFSGFLFFKQLKEDGTDVSGNGEKSVSLCERLRDCVRDTEGIL